MFFTENSRWKEYILLIKSERASFKTYELYYHCLKNEVSIKDFFSKCDQIRNFPRF